MPHEPVPRFRGFGGIVAPLLHSHKVPSGVGTSLVAQTLSGHRLHAVTYDDIRK
jgi:hypothetical protein